MLCMHDVIFQFLPEQNARGHTAQEPQCDGVKLSATTIGVRVVMTEPQLLPILCTAVIDCGGGGVWFG